MLTARQKQFVDFVSSEMARTGGVSPTFSEIGRRLGISSKASIHRLVTACVERGALERLLWRHRALRATRGARYAVFIFDDAEKVLKPLEQEPRT